MSFIGLGRPGQRESTTVGKGSEVDIPRHIYILCCLVDGIKALAATVAVFAAIAAIWTWATSGNGFWRAMWAGIRGAWSVIRWLLVIPFLAWLGRVWHHGTRVVRDRLEPEQMDPYAHAPYSAKDPASIGLTFEERRNLLLDGMLQDPEPLPTSLIPPVLVEERGVMRDLGPPPVPDTNGDWKLITFLRTVMGQVRAFSRRGAMRDGLYSRGEWEDLEEWAIGAGFHVKGSGILTSKGKRWAAGTIRRLVMDNHYPTPEEEYE